MYENEFRIGHSIDFSFKGITDRYTFCQWNSILSFGHVTWCTTGVKDAILKKIRGGFVSFLKLVEVVNSFLFILNLLLRLKKKKKMKLEFRLLPRKCCNMHNGVFIAGSQQQQQLDHPYSWFVDSCRNASLNWNKNNPWWIRLELNLYALGFSSRITCLTLTIWAR